MALNPVFTRLEEEKGNKKRKKKKKSILEVYIHELQMAAGLYIFMEKFLQPQCLQGIAGSPGGTVYDWLVFYTGNTTSPCKDL